MKKIVAAGLALTASIAVAQQPPAPPPGAPPRHEVAMKARAAEDIALLLDLKPAQRPALDAWLAAMPAFGPPMPPRAGEGHAPPEEGAFLERLDAMEKQIGVARSFYGQLDAQQKRRFDALERVRHAPPPGGRMMNRMPHPGGDRPE